MLGERSGVCAFWSNKPTWQDRAPVPRAPHPRPPLGQFVCSTIKQFTQTLVRPAHFDPEVVSRMCLRNVGNTAYMHVIWNALHHEEQDRAVRKSVTCTICTT
jgi:hypothetical protein